MNRIISSIVLVITLSCNQGISQVINDQDNRKEKKMTIKDWEFSKGGLGLIRDHIYVRVKSEKNEIRWNQTEKWVGQSNQKSEVVIFYENQVWSAQNLPDGFDLSKAILISFEHDKVRFHDFVKGRGAYFERIKMTD